MQHSSQLAHLKVLLLKMNRVFKRQRVISKIKEVLLLDYSKLDKWYGGEKSKYLDEPLVQYSV